jgi:hypothetical protein
MPTATKKAPSKTIAKKVPAPAPPPPSTNGDDGEPMIRVAFSADDLAKLVDHLSGWNDSIAYRLQMRLAKHQERWG